MSIDPNNLLLITGGTGLVGSYVAAEALRRGDRVRLLVRSAAAADELREQGAELVVGDVTRPETLPAAVEGVSAVVHCAAKVGDWGPVSEYRAVNVEGLKNLLAAVGASARLKHFVHISSLGVYEARDHFGTDETEAPHASGIDGYTLSKIEAERLLLEQTDAGKLPVTILRPGFIYGPRDRTVLPRILEKLKSGQFAYLGNGEKLMNNTAVKNLANAVFLALDRDAIPGEIYNITDGRLVTKREFIETIAQNAGLPLPTKQVPLPVARLLAGVLETIWRATGRRQAPILSNARIKFLGLNLDFCIDKAKRELGYQPAHDFTQAMQETIEWFSQPGPSRTDSTEDSP